MESGNQTTSDMQDSSDFRHRVFYTGCLYAVFFSLGWGRGQFGPSFADLQLIYDIDLETGSWIVTSFFVGYLFGSLVGGWMYDKINKKLMFTASHIIVAGTYFLIPWGSVFGLLVVMFIVQGIAEGLLDTVANAEMLSLWKKHGRSLYLLTTCLFCVGGVISPLVTSPFLLETSIKPNTSSRHAHFTNSSDTCLNTTTQILTSPTNTTCLHNTNLNAIQRSGSQLYLAFSITASLYLLVAILFLLSFFCDTNSEMQTEKGRKTPKIDQPQSPSERLKLFAVCIMCALFLLDVGIDESYTAYLSIFSVKQLSWTKTNGAMLISVGFFSSVASGFCGAFLVKYLNTKLFVGLSFLLGLFSALGIAVCAYFYVDVGIWIFVLVHAIVKANVFTLLFSWTNEFITPVTGKISSAFLVASTTGSSLNPILVGNLMEEYSPNWLNYVIVIEYTFSCFVIVAMTILTRIIIKRYGTVVDRCEMMKEEIVATTNKLLAEEFQSKS